LTGFISSAGCQTNSGAGDVVSQADFDVDQNCCPAVSAMNPNTLLFKGLKLGVFGNGTMSPVRLDSTMLLYV